MDTRDLGHARELGVEAARAGETVVALSGDGLVGVLADALRGVPGALLGVLPGGRGNDLARVLGIDEDAVEACATIAPGQNYESLIDAIKAIAGTWWHCLDSTWIIKVRQHNRGYSRHADVAHRRNGQAACRSAFGRGRMGRI